MWLRTPGTKEGRERAEGGKHDSGWRSVRVVSCEVCATRMAPHARRRVGNGRARRCVRVRASSAPSVGQDQGREESDESESAEAIARAFCAFGVASDCARAENFEGGTSLAVTRACCGPGQYCTESRATVELGCHLPCRRGGSLLAVSSFPLKRSGGVAASLLHVLIHASTAEGCWMLRGPRRSLAAPAALRLLAVLIDTIITS